MDEYINMALSMEETILSAVLSYDKSLTLKEKQFDVLKALFEGSDVIANLPTGYGKSLHESSARFLKMTAFPGREI